MAEDGISVFFVAKRPAQRGQLVQPHEMLVVFGEEVSVCHHIQYLDPLLHKEANFAKHFHMLESNLFEK